MESAVQHGTAAFVAGLQATGAEGNPAQARGEWRCGKRSAFPTSPHPRRRLRTNFKRGATLTIYLVQKIGQVKIQSVPHSRFRCLGGAFVRLGATTTNLSVSMGCTNVAGIEWKWNCKSPQEQSLHWMHLSSLWRLPAGYPCRLKNLDQYPTNRRSLSEQYWALGLRLIGAPIPNSAARPQQHRQCHALPTRQLRHQATQTTGGC